MGFSLEFTSLRNGLIFSKTFFRFYDFNISLFSFGQELILYVGIFSYSFYQV
jgi:hypothetical protein